MRTTSLLSSLAALILCLPSNLVCAETSSPPDLTGTYIGRINENAIFSGGTVALAFSQTGTYGTISGSYTGDDAESATLAGTYSLTDLSFSGTIDLSGSVSGSYAFTGKTNARATRLKLKLGGETETKAAFRVIYRPEVFMTATVNGQSWHNSALNDGVSVVGLSVNPPYSQPYVTIRGDSLDFDFMSKDRIFLKIGALDGRGDYALAEASYCRGFLGGPVFSTCFYGGGVAGSVTITGFDHNRHLLTGTFFFDAWAEAEDGSIIEVRNGSFSVALH